MTHHYYFFRYYARLTEYLTELLGWCNQPFTPYKTTCYNNNYNTADDYRNYPPIITTTEWEMVDETSKYFPPKNPPFVFASSIPNSWQVYDAFPVLAPAYPFEWERRFDARAPLAFARAHPMLPVMVCACYLLMGKVGARLMKNRRPLDLTCPLAAWNLSLCVEPYSLPVMLGLVTTRLISFPRLTSRVPQPGRLGRGGGGAHPPTPAREPAPPRGPPYGAL
eukprot:1190501-Prorocentrum_minimum.AAC.1